MKAKVINKAEKAQCLCNKPQLLQAAGESDARWEVSFDV